MRRPRPPLLRRPGLVDSVRRYALPFWEDYSVGACACPHGHPGPCPNPRANTMVFVLVGIGSEGLRVYAKGARGGSVTAAGAALGSAAIFQRPRASGLSWVSVPQAREMQLIPGCGRSNIFIEGSLGYVANRQPSNQSLMSLVGISGTSARIGGSECVISVLKGSSPVRSHIRRIPTPLGWRSIRVQQRLETVRPLGSGKLWRTVLKVRKG